MKKRCIALIIGMGVGIAVTACGIDETTIPTQQETRVSSSQTEESIVTEERIVTEESESDIAQTTEEESYTGNTADQSWNDVQKYGFTNGYSNLSFTLKQGTLQDEGDYYLIQAQFAKVIVVPKGMKEGDRCQVVTNEFDQTSLELTLTEDKLLTTADGVEYYYNEKMYGTEDGVMLYHDSDDRVDAPFYDGLLRIRKDAVTGAAIEQKEYTTVTTKDLDGEYKWFNGVKFDEEGHVTELIFFGD